MRIRNLIHFIGLILGFTIIVPYTAMCQSCNGHWVNNHPLTFQCISGQEIGLPTVGNDPPGCPINPIYTSLQTNSFVFDNPVNDFFVDFNAFDSDTPPGCPRMQIKINGIFYPLNTSNLTELPTGTSCFGSISNLSITSDGYITTAVAQSNGQGRLIFSGVNASSITISTNDRGGGIVVANPCFEPLPIQAKTFKGFATRNCEVKLEFESGIESNVRNIQVEGSSDGVAFSKLLELFPKGNDSRYVVQCKSAGTNFYRLKINDLDGNYEYSNIIKVKADCDKTTYNVIPNPTSGLISVSGRVQNDKVTIFDVAGREVLSFNSVPQNYRFDLQKLCAGIYILQIINAEKLRPI